MRVACAVLGTLCITFSVLLVTGCSSDDPTENALAELKKPKPSAAVLNKCWQHWERKQRRLEQDRESVLKICRAYLRRAALSDWELTNDHFAVYVNYRGFLEELRLPEADVKLLYGDYMSGTGKHGRDGSEILWRYPGILEDEVRAALLPPEDEKLNPDAYIKVGMFLNSPKFVREMEAAYARAVKERQISMARSLRGTLCDVGDAATLSFLRAHPCPTDTPESIQEVLGGLQKRLVKEYDRVGLDPPRVLTGKGRQ